MNRDAALRQLLGDYERQRAQNEQDLASRMEEAARRDPAIGALLTQRRELFARMLNQAFGQPQDALSVSARLETALSEIHGKLKERLSALSLPPDYLQPQYACNQCRDTGYVGEPVKELCPCLESKLLRLLYRQQGLAPLERENFEAFDETVFPDDIPPGATRSQRAYMRRLREICEAYADAYPLVEKRNLLFFGPSGLGKSFLMNSIAQRVLARGSSVMRITAYDMLSKMRAVHFGADPAEQTGPLFTVPLLLIDDLGTEPMMENITIVQLFTLLNERENRQLGTVFSTNFSLEELTVAYTERVASRLLDKRNTQVLRFWGQDVRHLGD